VSRALAKRPRRCTIPAPTPPRSSSVAFDRAADYYDQTRGFPAEVGERIADRIERAAGIGAEPRATGVGGAAATAGAAAATAGSATGAGDTGGRLLEIGVGTGRISLPLHRRGWRVFGIDLSGPMLDRYRAKAADEGLEAPAVLRGDATRLPFRKGSFGAVIEVHVLHLIPGWREAVAEVRRVLAPGGTLLISRRLWDRSEGNGPRALARKRHARILAEWGLGTQRIGVRGDEEMIASLVELGGRVEELEPVSWRERETWAEYLEILERRVWSESWQVPEVPWEAAVRRLRVDLAAEAVDINAPVTVERHVDLAAIRF
jgi:SAM-dependent methyltransferase